MNINEIMLTFPIKWFWSDIFISETLNLNSQMIVHRPKQIKYPRKLEMFIY